jgi:hypothetical protein
MKISYVRVATVALAFAAALACMSFLYYSVGVPWPIISGMNILTALFVVRFCEKTSFFYRIKS